LMEERDSLVTGRSNEQRKEDAAKRKEIFLAAYEEWGTIRKACEIAGISRHSYGNWQKDHEFASRMDLMRQSFAESLEQLALDRVRNPDKNRGSDVLLIGLLNANMPQKYRPQFAMSEDSAKELITEWRKAAKEVSKDRGEEEEKLPVTVEQTLSEILEKRGSASKEKSDDDGSS
jgi:molybdenum-dependent DNA-binding transcriptional regulator ModE